MSEPTNGGQARAYRALRESEELHRATLSNISDAVFLTDDDGLFTFICPNVDVIFGYVPDEVQAMMRISGLLGENLFDHAELTARGEIKNIEREITSKTGERRSLLIHLKKVSIQGSTVLYTCRDVTERKRGGRAAGGAPGPRPCLPPRARRRADRVDRPRDQPAAHVHSRQRQRRPSPAFQRNQTRRGHGVPGDLRRHS
jgi:PAS domain S-box-containing protein